MSYRCVRCNKIKTGGSLTRVAEIRNVNYDRFILRFDKRERRKLEKFDKGFTGIEYVREEKLCDSCYEEYKDKPPIVDNKLKKVDFVGVNTRRDESISKTKKINNFNSFADMF